MKYDLLLSLNHQLVNYFSQISNIIIFKNFNSQLNFKILLKYYNLNKNSLKIYIII
jgi:hypothetical protein